MAAARRTAHRSYAALSGAALIFLSMPATAQTVAEPQPVTFNDQVGVASSPLARQADVTALRMLREVYPGLRSDGRGESVVAVRALPDATEPAIEAAQITVDLAFQPVSTIVSGRTAFVLANGILIAAQIVPGYRFADALFVQTDPGGPPAMTAAFGTPGGAAVLIANRHHNSQERFEAYSIVGLTRDGKLAPLSEPLFLYSVSMADGACPWKRTMQRLEAFTPRIVRRGRPHEIAMQVIEEEICETETARERLGERRFHMVLKWDRATGRYVGGSKALDALNRQRLGN